MKKTKQRILDASLDLFNEDGITEVSLHRIAKSLGMSQGNLNYHFKKKMDITEALYHELVLGMNSLFENSPEEGNMLLSFHSKLEDSMRLLYQYRFFLRDIYKILKDNESLRKHYLSLQELRKAQVLYFFQILQQQGLMKKEAIEGQYERLFHRMNILSDNWINAYEIQVDKLEDPIKHYRRILFEQIYYYLTEEGQEVFKQLPH